jgi:aquaporin SIP
MAIAELIHPKYKHMIRGPSLKVDLHTGAAAELVLTFVITFAVLCIFLKGPRNDLMKIWLLAMSTVTLVMVGSAYTGPSMNPANVSLYFFFFHSLYNCFDVCYWNECLVI